MCSKSPMFFFGGGGGGLEANAMCNAKKICAYCVQFDANEFSTSHHFDSCLWVMCMSSLIRTSDLEQV